MVKFIDILLEQITNLDNAYQFKNIAQGKEYIYEFTTKSGTVYHVNFFQDSNDGSQYERVYQPINVDTEKIGPGNLTGEGDALKINATVMKITLDFLKRVKYLNLLLIRPISSKRYRIIKKFIEDNLPSDYYTEEIEGDILIFPKIA